MISGGGKSISYGELVKGQDLKLTIPVTGDLMHPGGLFVSGNPPLKPRAEYTIVGQPVMNPSIRPKLTGEMLYVGDIKLPGMVHARSVAAAPRSDRRWSRRASSIQRSSRAQSWS